MSTGPGIDARLGLPHAIEVAERGGPGKAIVATFTPYSHGGGSLEATVMRGDKSVVKYRVDANTGETVNISEQTLTSYITQMTPFGLASETVTMTQAIAAEAL